MPHEQEAHDRVDCKQTTQCRKGEREPDRKPQRPHAVQRDAGDRELDHAAERILAVAMLAQALPKGHADERITKPAHRPTQEQVLILDAVDGIDHHAVEQHEICAARLDVDVAERVEHAIVETRRDALEPWHAEFVADTPCCDDLEASAPLLHQIGDQSRRMLKVGSMQDLLLPKISARCTIYLP